MTTKHDCSIELRAVQLAATPARIAAMTVFEHHDKPLDALFLVENLSQQGIDRVTAFRMLNTFVEKGLLRRIDFGEGKARYELTSRGDHHHFSCRSCGSVQDIQDTVLPSVIKKLQNEHHFVVLNHSLEFFGICKKCLQGGKN